MRVGDAAFRDAMTRWASTVTVVAVREDGADDGAVHATTVTSFAPVSTEPPQVVVSLNPNAQALPFVELGGRVGISLLSREQGRWARVFADPLPVGPMPWAERGPPLVPGASVGLVCAVRLMHPTAGGSRLVVAEVEEIHPGEDDRPLLYWRRRYVGIDAE